MRKLILQIQMRAQHRAEPRRKSGPETEKHQNITPKSQQFIQQFIQQFPKRNKQKQNLKRNCVTFSFRESQSSKIMLAVLNFDKPAINRFAKLCQKFC